MKTMKLTFLMHSFVIIGLVGSSVAVAMGDQSARSSQTSKMTPKNHVKQVASSQKTDDFSFLKDYFKENNDGFAPDTNKAVNDNAVSKDAQYFVMSKTAMF